jgi:multiple sugar transport system permease protein
VRAAWPAREARLAWGLMAPALLLLAVLGVLPLVAGIVESFFQHDLRLPWLGRPFIGLANYREAVGDPRLLEALAHTVVFTAVSVALELVAGLGMALALDALSRWRGVARLIVLLPWALPTVVAALVWRLMFEGRPGAGVDWLAGAHAAWVPLVAADVWKTTPFVALLLLAGLQGVDRTLYAAARLDGAGAWHRFVHVTLPLLRPALVVAAVFRALDGFRVFDLVFVLTGGGPGTATEVVSLYAFATLLQHLRFGYGAAISTIVFAAGFLMALAAVRALGVSREAR